MYHPDEEKEFNEVYKGEVERDSNGSSSIGAYFDTLIQEYSCSDEMLQNIFEHDWED